ncbi:MAG: histidine kinase [Saprospiraceae bacterium]|nr:histidine kinase [Saprospiraceae bacterium]
MEWNKRQETILQIIFWLLLIGVAASMVSQILPLQVAILMSLKSVLIIMIVAYINDRLIIPRLFQEQRFWLYLFTLVGVITVSAWINVSMDEFLFPKEIPQPPRAISPFNRFKKVVLIFGVPAYRILPAFFITIAVLFITTVYTLSKQFIKKESQNSALEKEKIQHELNFLRSQINPHFIFNALNNLHAMVQIKPEKSGDYILKLGEMLRYVLEDCKKDKVTLAQEIQYIENYIFFQKLKDENFKHIDFQYEIAQSESIELEPMLFIALVENTFLHSYTDKEQERHIRIQIKIVNQQIQLLTQNNIGKENRSSTRREHHIGIANIKRRLALLYRGTHTLKQYQEGNDFISELSINYG